MRLVPEVAEEQTALPLRTAGRICASTFIVSVQPPIMSRRKAYVGSSAIKGGMGPQFLIIKCSATSHDLSNTRVLQNLMQVAGFRASDGWALKFWTRTLTLNDKKGNPVTKTYKVPYMIHPDGTVITIQHKAWMDTVRVIMWVDLLLGPYKGERVALIWDNCGPHGVAAVLDVMEEWNIFQFPLPKNMTDKLQVMDLVVNGPLKAAIRRARASNLFDFFQA